MIFEYKAKKSSGEMISGRIEADNRRKALEIINSNDELVVIDIFVYKGHIKEYRQKFRLKKREYSLLFTQILFIFKSGIPLLNGIKSLQRDYEDGKVKKLLEVISAELESGKSFGSSISSTKAFPEIFLRLIYAGEESGQIEEMIDNYLEFNEEFEGRKKSIIKSMIYPILVILTLMASLTFLSFFVFPKFISFFNEAGVPLPALTKTLFNLINAVKIHFMKVLYFISFIVFIYPISLSIKAIRRDIDKFKLKLPFFGRILRKFETYNFMLVFHLLYKSGLKFSRISEIIPTISKNLFIREKFGKIGESLMRGESISESLGKIDFFPSRTILMVSTGEKSGSLEDMLKLGAELEKRELDYYIDVFTEMIQPALIFIVSIVVAVFAVAIILPILDLVKVARFM